jgi:hypothetical protein
MSLRLHLLHNGSHRRRQENSHLCAGPGIAWKDAAPRHATVRVRVGGKWQWGRIVEWVREFGRDGWECVIMADEPESGPPWQGRYDFDARSIRPRDAGQLSADRPTSAGGTPTSATTRRAGRWTYESMRSPACGSCAGPACSPRGRGRRSCSCNSSGPAGRACCTAFVHDLYDGQQMRPEKLQAWRALRERYGNRDASRVDRGRLLPRPPEPPRPLGHAS